MTLTAKSIRQMTSAAFLTSLAVPAIMATAATPTPIAEARADARVEDVRYKTMQIQGIDIAYREAGDPQKPSIVLLHGFPTSSHMFRELIPQLATQYHVIAPDYPGFGASDMPAVEQFDYSFENLARVVQTLLEKKNVRRYALYLMDYGAPVGFRMFADQPSQVSGFVIQNGNAYEEGLQDFWDPLKAFWANPSDTARQSLRDNLLTIEATQWQWTHGIPAKNASLVSPDNWHHDQHLLDRPGNKDIQLQLFLSYGTNVDEYPKWQALFREHQIPALIVWGKGDHIFPPAGAHPYERDLNNVEKHILDTGHFALETHGDFISERIRGSMRRTAQ